MKSIDFKSLTFKGGKKFYAPLPFLPILAGIKSYVEVFLGGAELKSHPKTKILRNIIRQHSARCHWSHENLPLTSFDFPIFSVKDYWEIFCRTRALVTQTYVLAAAQFSSHFDGDKKRVCFGNSMIVDPWGQVTRRAPNCTGYISTVLDFD